MLAAISPCLDQRAACRRPEPPINLFALVRLGRHTWLDCTVAGPCPQDGQRFLPTSTRRLSVVVLPDGHGCATIGLAAEVLDEIARRS